uniref:Mucin n=1 Tax=Rhipicephalus appendiculatus TaxID=34631 RepID=A0A131YFU2_RHIAP
MGMPTGNSHTFDITSKASIYSTKKTVSTTTTARHNEITTSTSSTYASVTSNTQQANKTRNTATTTSKAPTSADGLSPATGIRHASRNSSDKSNELDSNNGSRESSTVHFLSTSTEKSARVMSMDSSIPDSKINVSGSAVTKAVPAGKVTSTNKENTDASTTSTSVSAASISEISNGSRTVVTVSSHVGNTTDNMGTRIDHISAASTQKSNRRDSNNENRQSSTTGPFSTSIGESTQRTSHDSHRSENINIVSKSATLETVTLTTAKLTHAPITDITTSAKSTTSADTELKNNTAGVFIGTSEASVTDEGGMFSGTVHASATITSNSNDHHNDATTSGTGSPAISTEESIRTPPGDSQISETFSTVSRTTTETAGTLQSTNHTRAENTDTASSTMISDTSVTSLKDTSESAVTSTFASTTSHVVSTDNATEFTSTISTHKSYHQDLQNGTTEGSLIRSSETSTTQSTLPSSDSQMSTKHAEISSSITEKTITAPKENADMRTSPARVTTTSNTLPANRSQTALIQTSTSTVIKEKIATGFVYPSTTSDADESNTQRNDNSTTKSSGRSLNNGSSGESTGIPSGGSHIPDTTSEASNHSAEKTVTTPKARHNESTKLALETSTSATTIPEASNPTNALRTSPKASTSTISAATEKHYPSRNASDNANTHENNHGFTEGSTVKIFSTSTEQNTRLTSTNSHIPEREKNVSSSQTTQTASLRTVKTTHEAHTDEAKTSMSVTAASFSEMSSSSRTPWTATSQAVASTDSRAIGVAISSTAIDTSNGRKNDNSNRQTSTTQSSSSSLIQSTTRTSHNSHTPESTKIDSNLPAVASATPQTANLTHEPVTDLTDSLNRTTASDTNLTQNNKSALISTSAASATNDNGVYTRTDHSSTTATYNENFDHTITANTENPATGSLTTSTEESTKMPHRHSQISDSYSSSRVTTSSSGKAETAETTKATALENAGMTSSTVTSNTSVLSLRNTSGRVFTSTSTTSTDGVRTDTVVRYTSTSTTKTANNHVSHNRSTEDSVTRLDATSTAEIARRPPRNSQVSNSASNTPSSTEATDERHTENRDMRISPATTAATSDTDSSISSPSVLIKTSTSTPNAGGTSTQLGHVPTTAADESNTQHNSETTKSSVAETYNAPNKGSTGKAHSDSHTSKTSIRMSSALTEKTATAATTKTATYNTSTTNSSTTSTSAASVTKKVIRTNDAVTTTSKAPSTTDGISTVTQKHHTPSNKPTDTREQHSNYGTREGATKTFHSTSTEKSTRITTTGSGIVQSERNVSSSALTETESVETVKTTPEARTDATTPSMSMSAASISEMSNTSRTVVTVRSHGGTSTENNATIIDLVSTTAIENYKGSHSTKGDKQSSTTQSFSKSTKESTKRASLDSHTSEGTVSNSPTVETVTQQTDNVTQEHKTTTTDLITVSHTELMNNNSSVSVRTSAISPTDADRIASGNNNSATPATRIVNVNHGNNATTSSSATTSVTVATEESTGMTSGDSQIPENSSTVSHASTGKTETAERTSNSKILEDADTTSSTTASRTSVTTLRNTSESVFTSTSTATMSTYVVSKDTTKNQTSTTTTGQSNNEFSQNVTTEGSITRSIKTSTIENARTLSGHSHISSSSSETSSSSTVTNVTAPSNARESGTSPAIVTSTFDTTSANNSQTALIETSTYTSHEAGIDTRIGHASTTAVDKSDTHQNNNSIIDGSVGQTTNSSREESTAISPGDSNISETTSKVSSYTAGKTSTAPTTKATHNASTKSTTLTGISALSITQHAYGTTTVLTTTSKELSSTDQISTAGGTGHPSTSPADKSSQHGRNFSTGEDSTVRFLSTSVGESSRATSVDSNIWDSNNNVSTSATREAVSEQRMNATRLRTTEPPSPSSISAASSTALANSTDQKGIATLIYDTSSTTITKANDHIVNNLTAEATFTRSMKFSTEESTRSSFKSYAQTERSSITSFTAVTNPVLVKNLTDEVLTSVTYDENTTTAFVPTHEGGATSLREGSSKIETSTDATSATSVSEKSSIDVLALTPAKPRSFPHNNDPSKASTTIVARESPSSPSDDSRSTGRMRNVANTTLATKSSMPESTSKSMDRQPTGVSLISSPTNTTPSSVTHITNGHTTMVMSSPKATTSTGGVSRTTNTERTSSEILDVTKPHGRNHASGKGSVTPSVTSESSESFSTTDSNSTESSSKVINMTSSQPTATNTSIHVRVLEDNNTATIPTTVLMTTASPTEQTSRSTTAVNIGNITEQAITNSVTSNSQPCRNFSSSDSSLPVTTTKMNNSNAGANISADRSASPSQTTYPPNAAAKQSTAKPNISATFLFSSTPGTAQPDSSLAQNSTTVFNSSDAVSYSTGQDTPRSEPSVVPQDSATTLSDNSSIQRSSTGSFSSGKAGNCSGKSEKTATQLTKASTITNPTRMATVISSEHNLTSASTLPPFSSSSTFAPSSYSVIVNPTVGSTSNSFLNNENISSAGNDSLFSPSTSSAGNDSLQVRNFTQTGHNSSVTPCISRKASNSRATSDKSSHTEPLTTLAILNGAATTRRSPSENSPTTTYLSVKTVENSNGAAGNFSTKFSSGVTSPTESANTIKGENSSTEHIVSSTANGSTAPCNSTHTEKHPTVTATSNLAVENPSYTKEAGARHDLLSAKPSRTSPGERLTTTPNIAPTGFSSTAAPPATVKDYILSAVHNGSTAANSNNASRANSSTNKLTTTMPCRNKTGASSIPSMDGSSSSKANTAEVESKSTMEFNTFSSVDTSNYSNGSTSNSQESDTHTVAAHNSSTHKLNVTGVESNPVQYRNSSDVSPQISKMGENSSDTKWSSGTYNSMTKPAGAPGCKNSTITTSILLVDNSTSNPATNFAVNTTSTGKHYINIWTTVSGPPQTWNDSNVTHRNARIEEMSSDSTRDVAKQNASTSESATPPPCKNSTSTRTHSSDGIDLNDPKSSVRAGSNSGASPNGYPSTKRLSTASDAAKDNKFSAKVVSSTPGLLSLGNSSSAASSSVNTNSSYVAPRNVLSAKIFNYTHTTAGGGHNSNNTNTAPPTLSSFITTSNTAETGSNSSNESSPAKNKKEPCQTNSSSVIKGSATTPGTFVAVNSSEVAADSILTNSFPFTLDTESYPADTESADLSKSNVPGNEEPAKNSTAEVPPLVENTTHPQHREPCAKTRSRRSLRSARRSRRIVPLGRLRT